MTANLQMSFTPERLDLLKRTIAKDTSDDELALFVATAQRLGLDPFSKQIYAVMRWDRKANRKVMSIQVAIDGFRSIASRTNEMDGQDGPYWCGSDGVWKDVWLSDEPPRAAKVMVYRKGSTRPFTGVATWDSYVQIGNDNKPSGQWPQMPDVMIAKCAEALALRKAFPSELAGVYTPDEMAQAENASTRTVQGVIEAAVVDYAAMVDQQETVDALKAVAPQINSLPKGSQQRLDALDAYKRRMSMLVEREGRRSLAASSEQAVSA